MKSWNHPAKHNSLSSESQPLNAAFLAVAHCPAACHPPSPPLSLSLPFSPVLLPGRQFNWKRREPRRLPAAAAVVRRWRIWFRVLDRLLDYDTKNYPCEWRHHRRSDQRWRRLQHQNDAKSTTIRLDFSCVSTGPDRRLPGGRGVLQQRPPGVMIKVQPPPPPPPPTYPPTHPVFTLVSQAQEEPKSTFIPAATFCCYKSLGWTADFVS